MAGAREVFRAGAKGHGGDGFGNQIPGARPNDMHAQDAIRFLVRQDFYFPFRVAK